MREEKSIPEALEDNPENRLQQAKQLIRFLSKSGILSRITSDQDKSDFIQHLEQQEAEGLLERINGIILGIPIAQRAIYEFSGAVNVDPEKGKEYRLPAHPSMQRHILKEIVIPGIKSLSPEDAPEVLATEINLLHMFQDGNGRLARIAYLLTKPGLTIDGSGACLELMTKHLTTREGVMNFDPSFLEEDFRRAIFHTSHTKNPIVYSVSEVTHIPEDIADFDIAHDPEYNGLSPRESKMMQVKHRYAIEPFDTLIALRETLFLRRKNVMDFLVPGTENGSYAIDCKKLIDSMRDEEDFECLSLGFDFPKKMRAQMVIEIYRYPDRFPSRISGVNLKGYFQQKVKSNASRSLP